eukprot:12903021-Prorocentrum_lima.AAC.1
MKVAIWAGRAHMSIQKILRQMLYGSTQDVATDGARPRFDPSKPSPSNPAQKMWTPKQGKGTSGQDPGTPPSREPQTPVPRILDRKEKGRM